MSLNEDVGPYQNLVVNLLSDKFVLAEGVAGLSGDVVDGALLHLLLDGTEQGEEGLAGTLLKHTHRHTEKKSLSLSLPKPKSTGPFSPHLYVGNGNYIQMDVLMLLK